MSVINRTLGLPNGNYFFPADPFVFGTNSIFLISTIDWILKLVKCVDGSCSVVKSFNDAGVPSSVAFTDGKR